VSENNVISLILASENDELARELRKNGIEIRQTRDGFEAIRMALESRPDAIVLDELTTGLPIPTVAVWLKLNPLTSALPVVGLSDQTYGWQEAQLDAQIPPGDAIEHLTDIVKKLAENPPENQQYDSGEDWKQFDPLTISLDLLKIYRERLGLASAMIELASLQHDLGDPEYTVKSILEAAGRALNSKLMSITMIRERTHYTLVRDAGYTKEHILGLEDFALDRLSEYLEKPIEIDKELVIGRRRLNDTFDDVMMSCEYFGYPVYSRGETLGYLSGISNGDDIHMAYTEGLLPDITAQIALLLVNADLIAAQEGYVEELSSILRAVSETSSFSILSDIDPKGFLLQFLLIILELCHTDRGCVVLFDSENGEIQNTASFGCHTKEVLSASMGDGRCLSDELPGLEPGEVRIDPVMVGGSKNLRITAPITAGDVLMGGLIVFSYVPVIGSRIIDSIKTLVSLAGNLLNNHALHLRKLENSVIEGQLNTARDVQAEMLPERHPVYPGYDIYGRSEPAREVGGDLFDYYEEESMLGIAIADVCGKSIPASLLMTMSKALFLAEMEGADGPEQVLRSVNRLLSKTITQGKFVTGSLLWLTEDKAQYASAGHQPLLLYRAETDRFEEIDAEGIAMGIINDMEFERVHFEMKPGDIAIMYTDGLNEAMDKERHQFGYENIMAVIGSNTEKDSEEIITALFDAIEKHGNGAAKSDDTTVVVIKKIKEEE